MVSAMQELKPTPLPTLSTEFMTSFFMLHVLPISRLNIPFNNYIHHSSKWYHHLYFFAQVKCSPIEKGSVSCQEHKV